MVQQRAIFPRGGGNTFIILLRMLAMSIDITVTKALNENHMLKGKKVEAYL